MDISQVFTYQDCIEHLIQYQGGASTDTELARLRTAVQMAYQDICWSTEWQYFHKPLRIQLSDSYSTGTIAYTASTRVLALTGGTFPTWAASGGRVVINNVTYQVQSRTDGTNLVLDSTFCPQANIASGTAYRIQRTVYLLPKDFRKCYAWVGEDTWTSHFISPEEWLKRERYTQDTGTPWVFTIMQTTDLYGYGRYAIFVQGYPDEDETLDCIYIRSPRDIKYTGYETAASAGTVTVSASATSVTGTSTTFSSDMVGSVIRFTTGSTVPGGMHSTAPFTEQHAISAYSAASGAGAITIDEAVSQTYTTKVYRIADPVDLPPSMRTALLRGCECQLDNILPNTERLRRSEPAYRRALIEARERESMSAYRRIDWISGDGYWRKTLGSDHT